MKILGPEILSQDNEKCDLWSLGIILYVLSFKEYPYNGDNGIEIKKSRAKWIKKNQYFSFFKEKDYKKYYKIVKKIGEGGFGTVYEAVNIKTDEKRTIKILTKNWRRKASLLTINNETKLNECIKDLFNEVENMKIGEGKNNENTVKYYEYFDNEIVMELWMFNKSHNKETKIF